MEKIWINNLDWSKEHPFDLYYAPCLNVQCGNDPDFDNMKLLASEWYYTNQENLLHACAGACAAARLRYKRGYIVAVEHSMKAIIHATRI